MEKENLIIIHGLNNNQHLFLPLINHFSPKYNVFFITLPCHGTNRKEAQSWREALSCFDKTISPLTNKPYSVIAFSLGALYLQLWLNKKKVNLPLKQVLLAPALEVNQFKIISTFSKLVPSFFKILSFMPREFRQFDSLSVTDYKILFQSLEEFIKIKKKFKIPTLIIIDPKDELVSAKRLQKTSSCKADVAFRLWNRPYLNLTHGLGRHHFLVHPRFFTKKDWELFLKEIDSYLVN